MLRFWLYQVPQEFEAELEIMRDEDGLMIEDKLGDIPEDLTVHRIIKLLDLTNMISVKVRAYEKEFFYLKCLIDRSQYVDGWNSRFIDAISSQLNKYLLQNRCDLTLKSHGETLVLSCI